jgi:hypothetical protein
MEAEEAEEAYRHLNGYKYCGGSLRVVETNSGEGRSIASVSPPPILVSSHLFRYVQKCD